MSELHAKSMNRGLRVKGIDILPLLLGTKRPENSPNLLYSLRRPCCESDFLESLVSKGREEKTLNRRNPRVLITSGVLFVPPTEDREKVLRSLGDVRILRHLDRPVFRRPSTWIS